MSSNDLSSNEVSLSVVPAASPTQAVGFRASFLRLQTRLLAGDGRDAVPITASIPNVVWQTTRLLPGILAMRARAATALPEHDLACFDQLEDCTGALYHSHVATLSPPTPPHQDVVALGAQVVATRDMLEGHVAYLVLNKLVDRKRLDPITKATGYKTSAGEVLVLVGIARECLPLVEGKILLTSEQLDAAELLAKQLTEAVAERDRLSAQTEEAQEMRQRAFTLFVKTYEQARRAITYLLWDDPEQLEAVCPSLYSGQRGKRSGKGSQGDEAPVAPGKATPGGGASKGGAVTPTGGTPVPVDENDDLPGGNPFLS